MSEENRMQIDCPHCHKQFSADPPVCEIVNTEHFSSIVAIHEKPIICPNTLCRQKFMFGIADVSTGWTVQPMKRESSIILPRGLKVAGRG